MAKKTEKSGIEFDISSYGLKDTDKIVFNEFVKHPNLTQNEIAERLNLSFKHVSKIKLKPAFQKALNDYQREDTRTWIQILIDARPKAAKKIVDLLNSDNEHISLRASNDILQLDKLDFTDDQPEEEPY